MNSKVPVLLDREVYALVDGIVQILIGGRVEVHMNSKVQVLLDREVYAHIDRKVQILIERLIIMLGYATAQTTPFHQGPF